MYATCGLSVRCGESNEFDRLVADHQLTKVERLFTFQDIPLDIWVDLFVDYGTRSESPNARFPSTPQTSGASLFSCAWEPRTLAARGNNLATAMKVALTAVVYVRMLRVLCGASSSFLL